MRIYGFEYPDEMNAYESGRYDFERGHGQNPWQRSTVEAIMWRNGYTDAMRDYELRLTV